MNDCLDQPLAVGDYVVYVSGGNGCAIRKSLMRVTGFTAKSVKVSPSLTEGPYYNAVHPTSLIQVNHQMEAVI